MEFKKYLYNFIYSQHWTLGFIEQPISEILKGEPYNVRYVADMPDYCWFADPFILRYDDNYIHVLVEEYNYRVQRGRIAKLIIDHHTYKLLDFKIVLDLPTHLSFPFIYRINDRIYICPENSESGSWKMYEYCMEKNLIIDTKTIINDSLTDAINTNLFGEDLIFSTRLPRPNGNILSVFSVDGILKKEITFPSNIARNAGGWFLHEGNIYRPAQDCNFAYGGAVIIQRVEQQGDSYIFTDVCRIESTHPFFTTGCHTFNTYKGLTVIDVHGWLRPIIANGSNRIRHYIGRKKI